MASISPSELAQELLHQCLQGGSANAETWNALVTEALHPDPERAASASHALFSILVEGLADQFEPRLCDVYAEMFAGVLAMVVPEMDAGSLMARRRRLRHVRPFKRDAGLVRRVFVLSRVTLGADVAVTSVLLDAVKKRFPHARIVFVGPRKNWELFAADPRIEHAPVAYNRQATLRERLEVWRPLSEIVSAPASITVDPDSRLTQLGLLPVGREEDYFLFESRSYGGNGSEPLPALARRWAAETFEVEDATPYVAPEEAAGVMEHPPIAVSFGVGENPRKRIADPFEGEVLKLLTGSGFPVWVDKGAGGAEAERVQRAIDECGAPTGHIRVWEGPFAPFAALIAKSALYVGYDSAGQHVAAACGTPLISVFAGYASDRMFQRWRPSGPGRISVLKVVDPDPHKTLEQFAALLHSFAGSSN